MDWFAPTVRLVRWSSLLAPIVVAAILSVGLGLAGSDVPMPIVLFVAAAVAAAAPASLDDPAHDLVVALPVGRRRRIVHRLVVVVPAIVATWALAGPVLFRGRGGWIDTLAPLGALVALGVSAATIAARTRQDTAAAIGVAVPLIIVMPHSFLVPERRVGQLTDLWLDHPWPTIGVASLVAAVASGDGDVARPWRRPGAGPRR